MFFSGEAGAGIPATKTRIETTFGAICVDTGSMEMTLDDECRVRQAHRDAPLGRHRLHRDRRPGDVVPIDGDGEGVPVYTHLERSSQPMIRLLSGDLRV
jgi:phenylacetate-CoA ligase